MKTTLTILALLAKTANAGIIEPNVIWDKSNIVTCFYESESQLAKTELKNKRNAKSKFRFVPKKLSKSERIKIKETVNKNYTRETTGIHFTGWQSCHKTPNADVIILEAKGKVPLLSRPRFNGRAVIGQDGYLSREAIEEGQPVPPDSERPVGFFYKGKKTPFVALFSKNRGTIVHEFGHIAGLRHEHINEESRQDKNCQKFSVSLNFKNLEPSHITSEFVTAYDSRSIMNYCWLQPNKKKHDKNRGIILSSKDIETLRAYYY